MNPLGPYGAPVAAVLAVLIVLAAVVSHLVPGLQASTFLDDAALLAIGVVFGTQVVQNGTQTKAIAALNEALDARARLDALGAPTTPTTPTAPTSPAPS